MNLIIATLLLSTASFAGDLFTIKKSLHPKNVLHFEAITQNCKLKSPVVSNHWIMGEESGQREALTSKEVKYFAPKVSYQKDSDADFSFGALELMGDNLNDKTIRIKLVNCVPKAYIDIDGKEIQVTDIYVDGRITMTLSWQTNYMDIKGIAPDGSKVSHRIE